MSTSLEEAAARPLSSNQPALEARSATRRFGDLVALEDLDVSVAPGEVLALVGPSGCGKSTLLELFAGLQDPDGGCVSARGSSDAEARLAACALMPQRDLLMPWRDALSNAALAPECAGRSPADARREAAPLFERFGLARFERAYPAELSGGMRQRVAFLRTLLAGRPVLLLDEPFGALDSLTRAAMQEWLAQALDEEPRTVVLVTHDVEEAIYLSDRVAVLSSRPGRLLTELLVPSPRRRPRRETVTSPPFIALRERALEALT